MNYDNLIDTEIGRRSDFGKRIAKTLNGVPRGLTFKEFMNHPKVEPLVHSMDFVSFSEMYGAYAKKKIKR